MSYDLDFWKYKKGVSLDNQTVYLKACCDGENVDGLEDLPIDEILKKIDETFSSWEKLDKESYENSSGEGAFQIETTPQSVRFDCYGVTEDDMNLIIEIMYDFGCPLYDPQVPERYDKG